jgi:hypothetical protein
MNGLAKAFRTANARQTKARALENRPAMENGDKLATSKAQRCHLVAMSPTGAEPANDNKQVGLLPHDDQD